MSKQRRDYKEGAIYHITQRGNNHAFIFEDQTDKAMFLQKVQETLERYPCKIYFYCLMDNHYHLLIEMMQIDLSRIMHRINLAYSKYFNKKYERSGTIFGQRYAAFPVLNENHFGTILMYIAYNPVKANMVRHPDHYHWSAHLDILAQRRSIVDIDYLLRRLGPSNEEAKKRYVQMIEHTRQNPLLYEDLQKIECEIRKKQLEKLFHEMIDDSFLASRILLRERCSYVIERKIDFIRESYAQGYAVREIANCLGIAERTILHHLR